MEQFDNVSREDDFRCSDENLSRDSVSEEYWSFRLLGEQYISSGIAMSVIMTLMFIIGVTWNLIVIIIILVKRLCRIPSVLLLLDMAITDLLFCLLIMPFSIVAGFAGEYIFGNSDYTRCQVCKFNQVFIILTIKTVFTLLLVTIDRLIYLKKPLRYHSLITSKKVIFLILLAWIVSLALALPPFFGFGDIAYDIKLSGICFSTFIGATTAAPNYAYTIFIMVFILPCVIAVTVINVWTVGIIIKYSELKNRDTMEAFNAICREKKHLNFKQQFIIARVFMAINIINFIAWLPQVLDLIIRGALGTTPSLVEQILLFLLFMSQPVVHPILQVLLVERVRNVLKQCFNILKCKCS